MNDIMTVKEVACYFKMSIGLIYSLANEGKLPGFKIGGGWRFRRIDIETFTGIGETV